MTIIARVLAEIAKAIAFVCAVALPAIGAWGLVLIVAYDGKFWLAGSFWYLGIGAVMTLFLCWRSSEPRRTLRDLLLQAVALFAFLLAFTVVRRITARSAAEARDVILLAFGALLFALVFGIAIRRRLRGSLRSNQALQPTAGRSDV